MDLKPFKTIQFDDFKINKFQDNVQEFLDQFKPIQFLRGTILDLSVTTTATRFEHGLQRQPVGWFVLDKTANSNLWRTAWDERSISFTSSSTARFKIWIF